jgi:hypothetical protein
LDRAKDAVCYPHTFFHFLACKNSSANETFSTLKFAQRARLIQNNVSINLSGQCSFLIYLRLVTICKFLCLQI